MGTKTKYDEDIHDIIETIDLDSIEGTENGENSPIFISKTIILDNANSTSNNNENYISKCEIISASKKEGLSRLLIKFIEKCLQMEDSKGMLNMMNVIIKIYKTVLRTDKRSKKIDQILKKAIISLNDCPSKKFTHIKVVYDSLKFFRTLKECEVVNVEQNQTENCTVKPERTVDVIELDDNAIELDKECDPTTNASDKNSTTHIRNRILFQDMELVLHKVDSKNKLHKTNKDEKRLNKEVEVPEVTLSDSSDCEVIEFANRIEQLEKTENKTLKSNLTEYETDTSLLIPIACTEIEKEESVNETIKQIENQIAICKKKIEHYETKEVDDDSKSSPYLISFNLKARVVSLYEKLCELKGESPIKRHKVTLRAPEGFPSGPTKSLEKLLNNKITSNGNPHFPDFSDVLACVKNANTSDHLGWSHQKVLAEAESLFQQCGQTLQKWRQKRDWKDIVSRVNKDDLDQDPADKDPELTAKLMENKKLAVSKENAVFERYTNIQLNSAPLAVDIQQSDSDSERADMTDQESNSNSKNKSNDEATKSYQNNKEITKEERESQEESVSQDTVISDIDVPLIKRIKLERVDHRAMFDTSITIYISDSSDSEDDL